MHSKYENRFQILRAANALAYFAGALMTKRIFYQHRRQPQRRHDQIRNPVRRDRRPVFRRVSDVQLFAILQGCSGKCKLEPVPPAAVE